MLTVKCNPEKQASRPSYSARSGRPAVVTVQLPTRGLCQEAFHNERAWFFPLRFLLPPAVTTDRGGLVTSWNRAAESLWSLPSEKALGRPLEELIRVEPGRAFSEIIQAAEERGSWTGECTLGAPGGRSVRGILAAGSFGPRGHSGRGIALFFLENGGFSGAAEAPGEGENRYRSIFRLSGVSIWEEDISELQGALRELKEQGVRDLRRYLDEHPEFIESAAGMIRVIDVNDHTLQLFEARSKEELLGPLRANTLLEEPILRSSFIENLLSIAEGRTYSEPESIVRTRRGNTRNVLINVFIPSENDPYKRMLVNVIDISRA